MRSGANIGEGSGINSHESTRCLLHKTASIPARLAFQGGIEEIYPTPCCPEHDIPATFPLLRVFVDVLSVDRRGFAEASVPWL